MGVIDETTHTLTCGCGQTESVRILQHGSSYGASWQPGKPYSRFSVSWGTETAIGPTITSATCNSCGATPDVSAS